MKQGATSSHLVDGSICLRFHPTIIFLREMKLSRRGSNDDETKGFVTSDGNDERRMILLGLEGEL